MAHFACLPHMQLMPAMRREGTILSCCKWRLIGDTCFDSPHIYMSSSLLRFVLLYTFVSSDVVWCNAS